MSHPSTTVTGEAPLQEQFVEGTLDSSRAGGPPTLRVAPAEAPRRLRVSRGLVMFASDAAMFVTATAMVLLLGPAVPRGTSAAIAVYPVITLVILAHRRRYGSKCERPVGHDLGAALSAAAIGTLLLSALVVLVGGAPLSGTEILWLAGTSAVTLTIGHGLLAMVVGQARRRGALSAPTLIVGAGHVGHLVARRLRDRPALGLRPIGFLDKNPLDGARRAVPLPVLGSNDDLERVLRDYRVERVIIAFSTASDDLLLSIARRCASAGVSVSVVPRLFEVDGARPSTTRLGGLPLVELPFNDPDRLALRVKYAVDRAMALWLSLVLFPLILAIALAVRVTMGGPILYRQQRVGQGGKVFQMLKFRTMAGEPDRGVEADAAWLAAITGSGEQTAPARDRTTPVGRFLRRYSLDELPQIWNIARGEMSLVGPRPERVEYVRRLEHLVYRYHDRHRLRPGITGWAQVNGLRGQTSVDDRVEWDNFYVENWSPGLDLTIILRTCAALFAGTRDGVSDRPRARTLHRRRSIRAFGLFMLALLAFALALAPISFAAPPSAADQYVEGVPTADGQQNAGNGKDGRPKGERDRSGGSGPQIGGGSDGGGSDRSGPPAVITLSPSAETRLAGGDSKPAADELRDVATSPSLGAPQLAIPADRAPRKEPGIAEAAAASLGAEGGGGDLVWLLIAMIVTAVAATAIALNDRRRARGPGGQRPA
jgi:exopolysaccharide biosynthesis polyprenyl glycosylphosphotransferase